MKQSHWFTLSYYAAVTLVIVMIPLTANAIAGKTPYQLRSPAPVPEGGGGEGGGGTPGCSPLVYSDSDRDGIRNSSGAQCFGYVPLGWTTNTVNPGFCYLSNPAHLDNCPGAANPLQENIDCDTDGDACDTGDYDGDGVSDLNDCAPGDNTKWRNRAYPDADNDGVRDSITLVAVACFGNTVPTGYTLATNGPDNCLGVANPSQTNTDGDAMGDACDPNDDNDDVPDASDCAPLDSTKWRNQAYLDTDNDGVRYPTDIQTTADCFGAIPPVGYTLDTNGPDNCPTVFNPGQGDKDSDGVGDLCDTDPHGPMGGRIINQGTGLPIGL